MGLSDVGKTLIYTRLLHNKFVHTHTSVKENSGEYDCGKVRTVINFDSYILNSTLEFHVKFSILKVAIK
jgi:GTPase SAR1 family protein